MKVGELFMKFIIIGQDNLLEKKHRLTMAIRPCQRGLPTANSLQANVPANLLARQA